MSHAQSRLKQLRGDRIIEVTMRFKAEDLPTMTGNARKKFVMQMLREQPALAVDAADRVDVRWLP